MSYKAVGGARGLTIYAPNSSSKLGFAPLAIGTTIGVLGTVGCQTHCYDYTFACSCCKSAGVNEQRWNSCWHVWFLIVLLVFVCIAAVLLSECQWWRVQSCSLPGSRTVVVAVGHLGVRIRAG